MTSVAGGADIFQHLVELLSAIEVGIELVQGAASHLAVTTDFGVRLDDEQSFAYDLAHSAASLQAAKAVAAYGSLGEDEARLAIIFGAEVLADLAARTVGRDRYWGTGAGWQTRVDRILSLGRSPDFISQAAERPGSARLDEELDLVRLTFRRFADERISPIAGDIHCHNADVPEEVIEGIAAMGGFGLSVPEYYGGSSTGTAHDFVAMLVTTEELSRASLGAGGSLVTRPEILAGALVRGGTEKQRERLLPLIASGAVMVAVAVTEPDHGSDVGAISMSAVRHPGGGWVLKGTKTWCTFAARAEVVMLLARSNPLRDLGHRGLSVFLVEKPRSASSGFLLHQTDDMPDRPAGLASGRFEGRPIGTIGYRGMHSYELSFDDWWVPDDALLGGKDGLGQGFYFQMQGFERGRLQTAARAIGVMQAAYEAAWSYSLARKVFGRPLVDYQLTRVKLGLMAATIQANRQFAYQVAGLIARGQGSVEASMVKATACRAAEWVTRECMQIHGGMGYAEEFVASRLFVDARVLSIFEGTDEVLCLKVIARHLLEQTPGHPNAEPTSDV